MVFEWQLNEANTIEFVMVDSDGNEVAGLSTGFTLQLAKPAGSFTASAGTKSEIGSGWYRYVSTAGEADTAGNVAIRVTGSGAVQQNLVAKVKDDPSDIADQVWNEALSGHSSAGSAGERLGRVPNAAAGASGGLPTVDSNNRVAGVQGTKNTLDDLNDPTAGAVADAVLDEAVGDHTQPNDSVGRALRAARDAADPWSFEVPSGYVDGTAGHTLGNLVDSFRVLTLTDELTVNVLPTAIKLSGEIPTIYRGTTHKFDVGLSISNVAQDLTGDAVSLMLKESITDKNVEAVLQANADVAAEGADGIAKFTLTPTETIVPATVYKCEITWTRSTGEVYVVYRKDLRVSERVANPQES